MSDPATGISGAVVTYGRSVALISAGLGVPFRARLRGGPLGMGPGKSRRWFWLGSSEAAFDEAI